MTMLELVISMVVLCVAVGGTLASLSTVGVLTESSHERAVAFSAAQQVLEQMQGEEFVQVFARHNGDGADDPGVADPGADFAVEGLNVQNDDADGSAGRILVPVAAAAPTSLFEIFEDASFGMPRDLNGDGIDALDHAGDYAILPVRVRVEWRDRSGNHFVELATVLRER